MLCKHEVVGSIPSGSTIHFVHGVASRHCDLFVLDPWDLRASGNLTGQSHHGATISIYAADPDGNELEIMWMLPRDEWGEYENSGVVMPLDLESEIARWSS